MNIKPIKTEQDYNKTLKRIEILMGSNPRSKKFDELNILTILVEAYEEVHYKIDPIEAIKLKMEQEGLKQKDLISIFGSASKVSEVLNKKRKLTLNMIRNLHRDLKIPFERLFRDYDLKCV